MGSKLASGLLHRHRAKRHAWPKAFAVDGLRLAPVHGPEKYKDAAFPWLVELSTRIREARMVISEVTARTEPFTARTRTEPTASDSKTLIKTILRGFARRRSWKSGALVRTHILRFRYWPFRAVALLWMNFQRSRALSNIALRMRGRSIPCLLTRRMQPSRMNITTSRYKSRGLDYLHARTPAITISRFSTISLLRGQASQCSRTGSDPGHSQR